MYQNQAFPSGSYEEMLSGNSLLTHHNYGDSVGGGGGGHNNELKFISSLGEAVTMGEHSNAAATGDPSCNSFAGDQNMQCQGLSLSLGSVMPSIATSMPHHFQYPQYHNSSFTSLMNAMPSLKANNGSSLKDDEVRNTECITPPMSSGGFYNSIKREGLYNNANHPSMCLGEGQVDPGLHGSAGFSSSTALNSQYLKAAQELLDEIVNVRKALKQPGLEKQQSFRDTGIDGSKDSDGKSNSQSVQVSSGANGSAVNSSTELSPADRQNLLDKKTKLLAMLDEVDKRYRQYCHQMQIVVSSFDMVAGCGAAEPYTALALRTISRHFRCLRDAISGQIQVTQRSLGEQEGIPRLRYVDQQLRQQKALQQLGVMRQAWRPQRGLPESSVSILRAWLFEHFLHPYPKDSEKIMLARQTGLTRNQVANWFINARVRLWKPMVEEMYKEEFGDSEMSCNLLSENSIPKASRDDVQVSDNNNKGEESQENLVAVDDSVQHGIQSSDYGENLMDSSSSRTSRKLQQCDQRFNMRNTSFSNASTIQINGHDDGNGCLTASTHATYDYSALGNFAAVGGPVSLALELRNRESNGLGMSNGDEIHNKRSSNQTLASSSENDLLDYHLTEQEKQQQQQQQHKFGNPQQRLLHEFVV
ncbi:hypothetical protein PIB30_037029 [Stylosanthes scabra]|uniref:Homeobox domain-containing protein n=1 Tax=Stylosanthes scabra TaxID=79078 RepID=A0ABU6SDV5_9FABA|nr:hypothetical protein [Stylosanthes scabra]